jgi:2-hydroxy fatty acid dioxygenase
LIDNVAQALLMAPFFVWMEMLFKLGYRPALRKQLDVVIAKKIAEMDAADKKRQ